MALQTLGHEQAVQRQRIRHLGAVNQRQALFRGQHHRRDAGGFQCVGGLHQFAVDAHFTHAQHGQRHVRQRRQVAGRADRTLGRDGRHDARVEQREQRIHDERTHAGIATRQAADLHQYDQAHHGVREQRAGADRMRQDQVALQLLQLLVRDAGLGQQAETGVDAVGGVALGHDGAHGGGRRFDDGIGFSGQRHRRRGAPRVAQFGQRDLARLQGPAGMVRLSHGVVLI